MVCAERDEPEPECAEPHKAVIEEDHDREHVAFTKDLSVDDAPSEAAEVEGPRTAAEDTGTEESQTDEEQEAEDEAEDEADETDGAGLVPPREDAADGGAAPARGHDTSLMARVRLGLRWRRSRSSVSAGPPEGAAGDLEPSRAAAAEEGMQSEGAEVVEESPTDNRVLESHETPDSPPAASGSDNWLIVNSEGVIIEEDDGQPCTVVSIERKVQELLEWMLAPAIHGIQKLGVPGATDRAELLTLEHNNSVEAAVMSVVAGSETTASLLVTNFCLERIPFLGCPTVLLRTLWGNLRSVLIIAALYGHDLESLRTQHEALLCLLPPGDDSGREAGPPCSIAGALRPGLVTNTAQFVARTMIKQALARSTGFQTAVDCVELARHIYSSSSFNQDRVDEDGFVHVVATPASAARELYRRRSFGERALFWCSLPMLVLGSLANVLCPLICMAPSTVNALLALVRRVPRGTVETLPRLFLLTLGALLVGRFLQGQRDVRYHGCARRLRARLLHGRLANRLREVWPQVVTMLVFALHALLPAASAFSAMSMALHCWQSGDDALRAVDGSIAQRWLGGAGWDLLHRASVALLGAWSFSSLVRQREAARHQDDDVHFTVRAWLRVLHTTEILAGTATVLAAWAYISIACDVGATRALGWWRGLQEGELHSALGVVEPLSQWLGAPPGSNPLWSRATMRFMSSIVTVFSQKRLVELLSRRQVLLQLIGAEHVMASTLCLVMKGVTVACANGTTWWSIAEFVNSVVPPAPVCVAIVALRQEAIILGTASAVLPKLVVCKEFGGNNILYLIAGFLGGAYVASAVIRAWYDNLMELESPILRIAVLVPGGISTRAKGMLLDSLAGVPTRAVQMAAKSVLGRVLKYFLNSRFNFSRAFAAYFP